MRRGAIVLLGLVSSLLLVTTVTGSEERVYTVSQVLAGLQRDPGAWVGRTALVRGAAFQLLEGCRGGQWCPSGLYTPDTRRPGPILLLEPGPADSLITRLRRIPLLDRVAPRPQHLRSRTAIVYRVIFQAVPHRSCDAHPCITAVLVDAAPPYLP